MDLRARRQLKVYVHEYNGRMADYRTPGLINCAPGDGPRALFAPLPEADWREGERYTDRQLRTAQAARLFAKSYNQTVFRVRHAQLVRLCPRVGLTD